MGNWLPKFRNNVVVLKLREENNRVMLHLILDHRIPITQMRELLKTGIFELSTDQFATFGQLRFLIM